MHPDADKINIASGLKLKWSGNLDLGDFYTKLKQWLYYEGYGDEMKNFKEDKYLQRMKAEGREIEIKWTGEKNVSDYFSNILTITMRITGIRDVEAQISGRKVKMNSASVELKLSADLVKNRQGKWGKKSFIKSMYENFVIKDRIDEYKLGLYRKAYGLHDEVKTYLELNKF